MNRRDQQTADIIRRTKNLDPDRLSKFYELVREAYRLSSIVDRVAVVKEIADRTPSDFHVLSNQEARRIDHFNGPSYSWERYCKELGRSVALGEESYLFQTIQNQIQDAMASDAEGFLGLHDVIATLAEEGHNPDFVLAPIAYMIGFLNEQTHSMEWGDNGRAYLLSGGRRLEMLWSSRGRPLDEFIVFDHTAGTWHVKLDPHAQGGRLTVAIGEQLAPHAVIWLAETVVKYEITDSTAFRAFHPNATVDPEFDGVR